jgi:alkylated DNA repair dioxygenase AlkB
MESEYWTYHSSFFEDLFDCLLENVSTKVASYTYKIYGKEFPSRRLSCVFSDTIDTDQSEKSTIKKTKGYLSKQTIPTFDWSESEILQEIKRAIEKEFKTTFDYCLVHVYRNGEDYISWHNDKEALDSDIVSISFGATRKFRFRKIDETNGWDAEYSLKSGDLIYMHSGCQRKYKHTVPIEKKVKESRINLTFRKV